MAVHVAYARALETAGWLEFRGKLFPLCAGMAAKSGLLDSGLRQSGLREGPGARPVLALDSSQIQSLALALGHVPSPLSLERFLASLSGAALEMSCSEVSATLHLRFLEPALRLPLRKAALTPRTCIMLWGLGQRGGFKPPHCLPPLHRRYAFVPLAAAAQYGAGFAACTAAACRLETALRWDVSRAQTRPPIRRHD